ncbi:hypothetical protein MRX96_014234 [Rhipicephalus microplus]
MPIAVTADNCGSHSNSKVFLRADFRAISAAASRVLIRRSLQRSLVTKVARPGSSFQSEPQTKNNDENVRAPTDTQTRFSCCKQRWKCSEAQQHADLPNFAKLLLDT